MFDIETVRKDFPILQRQVHGKPLVYLDNAATTQKPRQVIDALVHYYENYNANIHRGIHTLAEEATAAYEAVRDKVVRFIKSPYGPQSIVFTRNTTEGINLVANAWGRKFLNPGDEIVLTISEHHSNIIPWQLIAREKGASAALHRYRRRGPSAPRAVRRAYRAQDEDGRRGARLQRSGHQPGQRARSPGTSAMVRCS